jgi:hypothetical protein
MDPDTVRFNGPAESGTSLGLRRTSGRRASCSAEQVTGHAYDGEAPTVLGVGFEICLNEQFYALPATKELDANRRISEIHLLSATIRSSADRMRQNLTPRFGTAIARRGGIVMRGQSRNVWVEARIEAERARLIRDELLTGRDKLVIIRLRWV